MGMSRKTFSAKKKVDDENAYNLYLSNTDEKVALELSTMYLEAKRMIEHYALIKSEVLEDINKQPTEIRKLINARLKENGVVNPRMVTRVKPYQKIKNKRMGE